MRRRTRAPRVLLALAVLLTLLPALAFAPVTRAADPCVVTSGADSGVGTLRTAVDRVADGGCAGGTVTFALPGSGPWVIDLASPVRIDRALTVNGLGLDRLTVRRAANAPTESNNVVTITGTPVVLRDLTIADGRTSGAIGGSGVRVSPSAQRVVDVTLERVRVTGNQAATDGGGISATNANLTITDSFIENNSAEQKGGGLYLDDRTGPTVATLINTVVAGNTTGGDGGGISVYHDTGNTRTASLIVKGGSVIGSSAPDATARRNTAGRYGGGIASSFAPVVVEGSTVAGNAAGSSGGGIAVLYGTLQVTGSTISGNTTTGSGGGGIYVEKAPLTLTSSTISGNRATAGQGGGIYPFLVSGALEVKLTATTLVGNTATRGGGGIYGDAVGSSGSVAVQLDRTIAAGNTNNGTPSDCAGGTKASFPSGAYNLVGAGGGCATGGTGTLTLTNGLAAAIVPTLAANGGPTPTHDVIPGGPAHDKIPTDECGTSADQRGVLRPAPAGGKCDIGAVEYTAAPPSASPSASPSPSPSGPVPSFADVPAGYWAHDQIGTFAQRGITTGCGDNDLGQRLYCPERGVTRAEMATFLTRALGQDKQTPPATPTFADVPADYWAYGQIEAFVKLGITTGCGLNDAGQRVFCPDRGVTRAEMAAFLDRAKNQTELTSGTPTFADVPPSYWAYGWIERFFTLSITTGCGTDDQGRKVYCPDRGVTRAEMAVFIIRAYP